MFIKLAIRFYLLLLLSVFQIICPNNTWAQLNYTFERLNSENGLPSNGIKGLQFDEKSRFLWVATESGIVRYNGHSFQNFGEISSNANLNGRVVFFERAENGTLFGKLIDESVFKIQDNKSIIDSNTRKIVTQNDFIAYKYNLSKLKNNLDIGLIEYSTFKFHRNIYFITDDINNQQLKKVEGREIKTIANFTNGAQGYMIGERWFFMQNDGTILEVNQAKKGRLFFKPISKIAISNGRGKNDFEQLKLFQNYPADQVYILLGTKLYSLHFLNNSFTVKLITDKIPKYEFIRHLQIDKVTNTIYLGTDNRGVIVANPQYFKRILPNILMEGISTSVYAQIQLKNENVQINTGQLFGTNTTKSPLIFYKPSETNTYTSRDNHLYFTNSDGIIEYNLNGNKIVKIEKSKFVNRNSFVQVDSVIYGINENGVIKKNLKGNWDLILKFVKTPFNFIVYQLTEVSKGKILAATTDGLYKYDINKNSFSLFFRDKSNANFRSIYDLDGYYLLGTYGGGVYMYKSDTIKKLPLDQDGYLKFTHCFMKDNNDRIWASTNKGIFMSPKKSLIDFWKIGAGKIVYKYFGKVEGIDMLEMNGGCTPCAIKLKNGSFSVPGIDGLIQFNPEKIVDLNIIPKVYLDRIIINNTHSNVSNLLDLPSKTSKISFQLGISGMLTKENIRLEYKFDQNTFWNQLSIKDPILTIENPGFGSHKVVVRLRSTDNPKWEINEFNFNINYPNYLHPYMYLVYLLLIVGLILIYIRFKTIIYKRRQNILESEVAAKTVSLNKMNDFLLKRNQAKDHVIAIMNHDVLTPLKYLHITAKNVAAITNDVNVKNSINQIAKTSKDLEYLTSNMLNWVKFDNIEVLPSKQTIDFYELINELLEFVKPFNYNEEVEIINNVAEGTLLKSWPDTLRILLYNIIVNAIKSTKKGSIVIELKSSVNGNIIVVKDTGVGMSSSMVKYLLSGYSDDGVENLPKYKKGNGVGYQIIRHIVNLMKASIDIESKEGHATTIFIHLND